MGCVRIHFAAALAVALVFPLSVSAQTDELTPLGSIGKKEIVCRIASSDKVKLGFLKAKTRKFSPLAKFLRAKRNKLEGNKLKKFNRKWRSEVKQLKDRCRELIDPNTDPGETPTPGGTPEPTFREVLYFANGSAIDKIELDTNNYVPNVLSLDDSGIESLESVFFDHVSQTVFWAERNSGALKRKVLPDGAVETLATVASPSGMTVLSNNLIVYTNSTGLYGINLDGTNNQLLAQRNWGSTVRSIHEYRTSNEVLITSSLGVVLVDLSTGAVSPIYSTSSNESLVTIAPDVNGDRLFLLVLESSFSIKLLDMTTLSVSEVTTPSGAGFDSNLYFDEASEHLFMGEHSAIKEFDLAGNVIDRVIVPHQGFWLEWFDLGPTPGSYIFATGYPTQIGLYDPSSSNEASILVKAKAGISDVEFHRGEQSLYWRDQRRSEIARAFLSAPTDVEVLRHFTSGSSGARGLALDEANGFLYWNYSGVLRGLSFSLPSFDLVPPESPAQTYYGSSTCLLSFDKKRGAIAWAQYSNSESILFEQIPSSGEFSPILSGELRVTDIAVGPVSGKTYFLARDNNTSASFLGVFDPATGTLTTLFSDLHTSKGLTISDDEELIFWTDSSVRTVNMGSTEGGDVHELLRLPTGELEGITFALERVSP